MVLETWMVNMQLFKRAFLTKSVGLNKNMVRWFSLDEKIIASEKNSQSQFHVSVPQAVDEGVQHGGHRCVHQWGNHVCVIGLAWWGGK